MAKRLEGRAVVVTGAGSVRGHGQAGALGNGRAAALAYASEGARVVAVDLSRESAQATRDLIERQGGECAVLIGDVSQPEACQAMVRECVSRFGTIDVLHHNVGILPDHPGGALSLDLQEWDRVMAVNVKSALLACRAALPKMIEQGRGCITSVSSVAAVRRGQPEMLTYSVSKAALNALTKSLATEFAARGVRVNCLMLGLMDTPAIYETLLAAHGGDMNRMREERARRVPIGRMGTALDSASAAVFLASDEAAYITGQILAVDGGLCALAGA